MMNDNSYRSAFVFAILIHLSLAFMLLAEFSSSRPVLVKEAVNEPGELTPIKESEEQHPEVVKAVSVDSQEVMQTVNRLKQERVRQQQAEQARQNALRQQAEMARKERLREQQQLKKLKEEEAALAIARKKKIEEEQKHLKQLAQQKEQEAKNLAELKNKQKELEKKQKQDAEKLAELKKKQAEEQARITKELAAKAEADKAKQREAAEKQAAADAAKRARLAGEVDKYKALIINAISQRWILPDNVDSSLSSQFRIRLAPDGAVLEVSLMRSSGDAILDRSAQTAIYKASPLPVPVDPATFDLFRDISLTVRPQNVRG
ncbi:cell envelope integrity protein TolA [Legionella sp. CNM-4043-24]|uniref:cell envelope integrity protein TolA n=1 Tax=Legionella sp. CNM-4043-24 TaxID=3421646 RepID=UPI00403ADCE9